MSPKKKRDRRRGSRPMNRPLGPRSLYAEGWDGALPPGVSDAYYHRDPDELHRLARHLRESSVPGSLESSALVHVLAFALAPLLVQDGRLSRLPSLSVATGMPRAPKYGSPSINSGIKECRNPGEEDSL